LDTDEHGENTDISPISLVGLRKLCWQQMKGRLI
jgi:hypothetical protein